MAPLVSNEFGQVLINKLSDDISFVIIESKLCTAKVSLHGGQVLQWQPKDHQEVFWLSDKASYQAGKAIRGGIPLCWPWFGANPTNDKACNHGFARTSNWAIEHIDLSAKGATITLVLSGENKHEDWPFAFSIKQTLFFGSTFSQSLAMTNLSDNEDVSYSAALHSYFLVSSPQNTYVDDLSDVQYEDKLLPASKQALTTPLKDSLKNCVGPLDRIYQSNKKLCLVDKGLNRTIEISTKNTHQWVLWNPGVETASAMSDIHLHGEQTFVCLEAANTNQQLLPVGETVTISQDISVKSLVSGK